MTGQYITDGTGYNPPPKVPIKPPLHEAPPPQPPHNRRGHASAQVGLSPELRALFDVLNESIARIHSRLDGLEKKGAEG